MRALYRDALALRRSLDALGDGALDWVDVSPDVPGAEHLLVFRRAPGFVCALNTGPEPFRLGDLLPGPLSVVLSSESIGSGATVPGDAAAWLTADHLRS
jgi:alpha-glucosidase